MSCPIFIHLSTLFSTSAGTRQRKPVCGTGNLVAYSTLLSTTFTLAEFVFKLFVNPMSPRGTQKCSLQTNKVEVISQGISAHGYWNIHICIADHIRRACHTCVLPFFTSVGGRMSHAICMWHVHPLDMRMHFVMHIQIILQMCFWHPTSLCINIRNTHPHTHTYTHTHTHTHSHIRFVL